MFVLPVHSSCPVSSVVGLGWWGLILEMPGKLCPVRPADLLH